MASVPDIAEAFIAIARMHHAHEKLRALIAGDVRIIDDISKSRDVRADLLSLRFGIKSISDAVNEKASDAFVAARENAIQS